MRPEVLSLRPTRFIFRNYSGSGTGADARARSQTPPRRLSIKIVSVAACLRPHGGLPRFAPLRCGRCSHAAPAGALWFAARLTSAYFAGMALRDEASLGVLMAATLLVYGVLILLLFGPRWLKSQLKA